MNSHKTSETKKFNTAFKGLHFQTDYLREMFSIINKLKVVNSTGQNISHKIKCSKGLKITINADFHLWELVKEVGFEYLFTRRLNQDCLENFFGTVRQ